MLWREGGGGFHSYRQLTLHPFHRCCHNLRNLFCDVPLHLFDIVFGLASSVCSSPPLFCYYLVLSGGGVGRVGLGLG